MRNQYPTTEIPACDGAIKRSPLRRFGPILVLAAGLAIGYAMGWHHYLSLEFLAESRTVLKGYVADNPVLSAVLYVLAYFTAVACSFPAASILTIFGGFLFGWLLATVLVAIGATAGATALFLAARSACQDGLRRKISRALDRLAPGFEKDAFSYLIILRLAPFVPFFIVNIAPAFFNVRIRTFVIATVLGILPAVVAYSYLGQGVDSVLLAAMAAGRDATLKDLVTPEIKIAFAALAAVAILAVVIKKKLLRKHAAGGAHCHSSAAERERKA